MMKQYMSIFVTGLALCLYSNMSVASIRCNGEIIDIGTPEYQVIQDCGDPFATHVISTSKDDESYAYYKLDGRVVEVHYIDGHIADING